MPFKDAESHRQWYIKRREHLIQYAMRWAEEHPERVKQYRKRYYKTHLEESKAINRKWKIDHPERVLELGKRCRDRRRSLDFVPLNKYFEGSEAHHLNDTYVVYIPKNIHQSIYHCLETGENMLEINSYALNYIQVILYPKEV